MKNYSDRNRTTEEWAESDYILPAGLVGYDTDTNRHKYGDGTSTWSELPWPQTSSGGGSLVLVDENGNLVDLDGNPVSGGGGGELPEDLTARLLPTDGEPGVSVLSRSSDLSKVGEWVAPDPLGKYRGTWGPDEELFFEDFVDGTVPPFVNYQPGSFAPTLVVEAMASNTGTSKPSFGNVLKMSIGTSTANARVGSRLDLSAISAFTGKTPTRVKYWGLAGGTTGNRVFEFLEDEVVKSSLSGAPWAEYTVNLGGTLAYLNWQIRNSGSSAGQAHYYMTGLRIYGTANPYMRNDVVDYGGSFYKSTVNNNAATPGADVSWELIVQ